MSNIGFRRASIYRHAVGLNKRLMEEIACGLLLTDEQDLRRSSYKLTSHIATSLSSHYPNDQLLKLNYALHHLQQIKRMLKVDSGTTSFDKEMGDIMLQIEKLIKVHMKNVWK